MEEVIALTRARKRKIYRKQRRKKKIRALRKKIAETNDAQRRRELIAKLRRVSPDAPVSVE